MSEPAQRATLLNRFLHWERTQPQATWLTQPHTHRGGDGRVIDYSWVEAGDQARRMAAHLQAMALPPGSRIALLGLNSAHWMLADLAIWMAGHVTVPMYPTLGAEGAAYILEHSETRLMFVGKRDAAPGVGEARPAGVPTDLPIIGLPLSPPGPWPQWDAIIASQAPLTRIGDPDTEELATIVYTSGSTGRPKGVMHSHGSMTAAARALDGMYALTSAERMLSYLPLAHVAERAAVESTSLFFGFRVYFGGDLSTFQADLKRARPTVFFSVPRLWTKFYQAIKAKLPPTRQKLLFGLPLVSTLIKRRILREMGLDQVRFAITGSAPLPSEIIAWYRGLGLELLDCYGMSENFGVSHASRPGQVRIGYVGTPVPGVEARIAANGELLVKSPGQMMGYYKALADTAKDLDADGFFRTGDRGEIDAQGRLRITGRVKELFKTSKGKYVAPVPIENRLAQLSGVECVCLTGPGQPQPFGLLMLSAEIAAQLADDPDRRISVSSGFEAQLARINAELEDHERLDYLVVVREPWTIDNGFLTPTMKIRRSVIEARYLPQAEAWRAGQSRVIWE